MLLSLNRINRRVVLVAALILVACLGESPLGTIIRAAPAALPERLADREFWQMTSDFSEPNGDFQVDNLLSNEISFQNVIPDLTWIAKPRRAYMGVGPEQNFTYIAALKPRIAFIVDIRRGNLNLHLMYKALFELSADRAGFVSRLFSKARPGGLGPRSTAAEIFAAYSKVDSSEALYQKNLQAIDDWLVTTHGFALSPDDLQAIEYTYHAFYQFGPRVRYSSTGNGGGRWPTYIDLMEASDGEGQTRAYLASEDDFAFVKNLETRNLIVPIVGNFAGPKAIRAVGKYLKSKQTKVSAFYLSNVEQFLRQDGIWGNFCDNVATLPLDETSTFIRSSPFGQYQPGFGYGGRKTGFNSHLGAMAAEVKDCVPPPPRR